MCTLQALPEAQWINCDVRTFDMTVLGKFGVIMADPPWEIHQDLPYGTMADDEMRKMNIGTLQDDGVIFLWVTGKQQRPLRLWDHTGRSVASPGEDQAAAGPDQARAHQATGRATPHVEAAKLRCRAGDGAGQGVPGHLGLQAR